MKNSFVKQLKGNAIFQMSLSSKELFHSNFLAWLAEDENTRDIFNQIMRNWLNDPTWKFDENQMMIKREYKNFDFCICEKISLKKNDARDEQEEEYIPGSIIFVLENKFKSIPYKEQLQKYHQKVLDINVNIAKFHTKKELDKTRLTKEIATNNKEIIKKHFTKTKYVLLNLATGLLAEQTEKDNSEDSSYIETTAKSDLLDVTTVKWHIVTYADYATRLDEAIQNDKNWKDEKGKDVQNKGFYKKLIHEYCEFVLTFSTHINDCLDTIKFDENSNWSILCNDDNGFQELRCNDIWQKLVMHKCAQHLISKIDNQKFDIDFNSSDKHIWEEEKKGNKDKLYIGIGFYHGEAFLEYKYRLSFQSDEPFDEKEPILCLQQQGNNTLSVGVVIRGLKIPKKKNKSNQEKEKQKWDQEVENKVGKYYPTNIEYHNKKYYSYQGDYCSFFYYHLAEKEVGSISSKDTDKKEYSICKTLDKMIELMNIAIKSSIKNEKQ